MTLSKTVNNIEDYFERIIILKTWISLTIITYYEAYEIKTLKINVHHILHSRTALAVARKHFSDILFREQNKI